MSRKPAVVMSIIMVWLVWAVSAQAAPHMHYLSKAYAPTMVVQPPGSQELWVLEKIGKITDLQSRRSVLNIISQTSFEAEQGILGIAFDPVNPRQAYVTNTDRGKSLILTEYQLQNGTLQNPRTVMVIPKPFSEHNGGTVQFGRDGYLYLGVGDGGVGPPSNWKDPFNNAQNPASLLGKILRINPRQQGSKSYSIPRDNPFVGRKGWRGEIWHLGLRNPWKWKFDSSGRMWIGDVGANAYEEINLQNADKKGMNFGWKKTEGPSRTKGLDNPLYSYRHSERNGCAVIGGLIVKDQRLPASWRNRYLFGDFCQSQIRLLSINHSRASVSWTPLKVPGSILSSIDQDQQGRIYFSSLDGRIWRLDP